MMDADERLVDNFDEAVRRIDLHRRPGVRELGFTLIDLIWD